MFSIVFVVSVLAPQCSPARSNPVMTTDSARDFQRRGDSCLSRCGFREHFFHAFHEARVAPGGTEFTLWDHRRPKRNRKQNHKQARNKAVNGTLSESLIKQSQSLHACQEARVPLGGTTPRQRRTPTRPRPSRSPCPSPTSTTSARRTPSPLRSDCNCRFFTIVFDENNAFLNDFR